MFNTFLLDPLYNAFVGLMNLLPFADAGVIIILFTGLVSAALYPLSKKSLMTQLKMKRYEGELAALKEKYKDNREEQARRLFAFYKEKGINPLSSVVLTFIQIPVIIALYMVFTRTGLPQIDAARLYSFIPVPGAVDMHLFGLFDITGKSAFLAALAALCQFVQGWFSPALAAPAAPRDPGKAPSFEESFAASMRIQTRYILPAIIFLISYQYSAVVALYFATRSAIMFGQEYLMRRRPSAA